MRWLWSPLNFKKTLHLVRRAENVSLGEDDPHNNTLMEVVANARMHVSVRSAHLNRMKH
jgi:hypothetical protein